MIKITLKNRAGFTIVELLIVLGMLGVVMGAIYSLYSTHRKSAYSQVEVVDVQQNLRIAMDSITRDVRMAGFLVPSTTTPILVALDATGAVQPLPAPNNVRSDDMTLNTASATETYARIQSGSTTTPFVVTGSPFTVTVDSPEAVDAFTVNDDRVRIVKIVDRSQPRLTAEAQGTGRVYQITGANRATPSLTLTIDSGSDPTNIELFMGDMICKTAGTLYPQPNTVRYCLGPVAACGNTVTTCPTGQLCLIRVVNEPNGSSDVIAQNMAGLQFRYLMDDGTELNVPNNYDNVRAVRVTLMGQTVTTTALSGAKERQLDSVIQIKNR